MNIYAVIAAVALLAVTLAGTAAKSYSSGHKNGVNEVTVKWDKDRADRIIARAAALKAAQDAVDEVRTKLEAASAELEKARNEKQIVYRTIVKHTDKIIDRPVYSNVCLDADGVRDINAALAGSSAIPAAPESVSEPAATVPGADAAGRDGR